MSSAMSLFVVAILCLALRDGHALSQEFDESLVGLLVDASPLLFPPTRVSAYLCLGRDREIALSRTMSRHRLAHEMPRRLEILEYPIEHRGLYVVDLDCPRAAGILREANSSGMFVAPAKWLLLRDRRPSVFGNDPTGRDHRREILETFEGTEVYPDSDVVVATRSRDDFVDLTSVYRPSPYRDVLLEDRGNWTTASGFRPTNLHAASRRRRNLRSTPLKSCLVVTSMETIKHLADHKEAHVNPITKINYPWIRHLVDRMNATVSFAIEKSWGYRNANGSWDGMLRMLDSGEIDIGGTSLYLTQDRIGVVQYVQLYTRLEMKFVFRQPLLSTVKNIFVLPFHRSVWIATGVLFLLIVGLLFLSTKWESRLGASADTAEYWKQMNPAEQTLSDNCFVVLGAVAQQGYPYEPYRVSTRIVTLMLLIAVLSLYASYTANIVALLQSRSDSIRTMSDLLNSPLKLGVLDTVYNRYYFANERDPVRKAMVAHKIEQPGQKSGWMTLDEGVRRIREEPFAFHAAQMSIYPIMQRTYQEEEKCGISEIDYLNLAYLMLPIKIRSPYVEIFKTGALLIGETGLKQRDEHRVHKGKPRCHDTTSFITIGFTESYFALASMVYGAILSVVVLAFELLCSKRHG